MQIDRQALVAPDSVIIATLNAEGVAARAEVGVGRLPNVLGRNPFPVKACQHISILVLFRVRKIKRGKFEAHDIIVVPEVDFLELIGGFRKHCVPIELGEAG